MIVVMKVGCEFTGWSAKVQIGSPPCVQTRVGNPAAELLNFVAPDRNGEL